MFIILQIFFATRTFWKIWEYINNSFYLARKYALVVSPLCLEIVGPLFLPISMKRNEVLGQGRQKCTISCQGFTPVFFSNLARDKSELYVRALSNSVCLLRLSYVCTSHYCRVADDIFDLRVIFIH